MSSAVSIIHGRPPNHSGPIDPLLLVALVDEFHRYICDILHDFSKPVTLNNFFSQIWGLEGIPFLGAIIIILLVWRNIHEHFRLFLMPFHTKIENFAGTTRQFIIFTAVVIISAASGAIMTYFILAPVKPAIAADTSPPLKCLPQKAQHNSPSKHHAYGENVAPKAIDAQAADSRFLTVHPQNK